MEKRINFKTYITIITMVVLINLSLFFFLYQASRYDSVVASVHKNEQLLAHLEDENRTLVAASLSERTDNDVHIANLIYKDSNRGSDV